MRNFSSVSLAPTAVRAEAMGLPSVSVIFISYRQERFVEKALRAALAQDLPQFELIIADDASPDGTWAVIEAVLSEPIRPGIRVKSLRQPKNLGILGNFNAAVAMATGEVFVTMAGDDISVPDRLRRTGQIFTDAPRVQLVYGEVAHIDDQARELRAAPSGGKPRRFSYFKGRFGRIYAGASPCGASAAYRRRLFDVFGPMGPGPHAEDNCYWIRALLLGEIHHDPACFVQWRQHAGSVSNFGAIGDAAWRRRHLAWMENHASMSPQWLRDIAVARGCGLISAWRAACVRYAAKREDATWALQVSSLRPDPWRQWLRLAWKLVQVGRYSTTLKMFRLRLFELRREKRWGVWSKLKSNSAV